jgi:ribosomal protein S12 methylthiotransferase
VKIGLLSLGCPKNLVDGEVMLGLVRQAGHEITPDAADADVLVVNTCAFIDSAKQESIDAILEMAARKRDGGASRLVVTGCLAERYRDELRREIPEIDAVLGTGDVEGIVNAIGSGPGTRDSGSGHTAPVVFHSTRSKAALTRGRAEGPVDVDGAETAGVESRIAIPGPPTYLYGADTPRVLTTPRHFAYVKIAEGCDYTCAFCIIPTLRGQYRSRTADSIVAEAEALAARGVRELLLISQDTTFYGLDRKERGALAQLLRRLNAIAGLAWIRLLYLYPTTITDDVLDAMAECEKVCRYIDLPLQHASADVLRRMRRPGNRPVYDKLLARIRARVPDVTLRTTFIVGFPGETAAEFAELEAFVEDTGFDHVGVFTYSHEEGTRAHALADDVPAAVKRRRRNALMARQKRVVARRLAASVGRRVRVLVDGPSEEHALVVQGRLEGQAPDIDAVAYFTDCDPSALAAGDLVDATIVGASGYDVLVTPAG